MRKPKENDQYVKAVEYSHALEKLLIMERENSAALRSELESTERERDELRKTLQATQGGAAEAIKNVMRLQEEISRLDKESQRLSDQLAACDRQRFDWLKRALTAEAELARRDAAAVAEIAPPAVLPPKYADELTERAELIEAYSKTQCEIAQELGCDSDNESILKAIYELKELGAQHQKVVELHKRKSTEVISGQRYSYVLLEDLLPELDAAGVKWEVKK